MVVLFAAARNAAYSGCCLAATAARIRAKSVAPTTTPGCVKAKGAEADDPPASAPEAAEPAAVMMNERSIVEEHRDV